MLARLRAAGLRLRADGVRLIVEPRSLITDALAEEMRATKLALLHELASLLAQWRRRMRLLLSIGR